jgi:hypothetical protein
MGKGLRFTFIFFPLALTVATLVCLGLVFGAGLRTNTLQSFYFFKVSGTAELMMREANHRWLELSQADTSDINTNPTSDSTIENLFFLKYLDGAKSAGTLKDYYQVDLFSYCTGDEGKSIDYCSKAVSNFWFNPVEVWGLTNTGGETLFPKELQDGLDTYRKVAHWMYVAYIVALAATVAELIIGLFATCSRIISLLTSLVAAVSPSYTPPSSHGSCTHTCAGCYRFRLCCLPDIHHSVL